MSFGLFASDSTTTTNVTTNNLTNSNNVTNSSSNVISEAGNISINVGQEGLIEKALPVIIVVALFLLIFSGGKKFG
ncbi:MAG: hypothetical protein E6Q97_28880 [Desulfurellales bacterium]|nr:MAG: hypothetical protein E6Q97_28880 [Desulfurellales bacterium]